MAAVTLLAPDGQRALPVFTSLDSLGRWDPAARPVPATAARVGQAAVAERCDVVVVDVAGPVPTVLRPSMVWALAQDRAWVPPHEDPFVATAVARAVAEEDDVAGHALEEGTPPAGACSVWSSTCAPGLDGRAGAGPGHARRRAPGGRRGAAGPDRRPGLPDPLTRAREAGG